MDKIHVVIVDDQTLFRQGIKALLSDVPEIKVVGEFSNGQSLLDWLEKNHELAHVVLMDIHMPELNGPATTQKVKSLYPKIFVLALSISLDQQHMSDMINAGSNGYLLKNVGKADLIDAIKAVSRKATYFSQDVANAFLEHMQKNQLHRMAEHASKHGPLTLRETEVLQLIAEGKTNNEIATHLYISPRTVDTHRRNLLQKIQVRNTAGLVRYAFENNLLPKQ